MKLKIPAVAIIVLAVMFSAACTRFSSKPVDKAGPDGDKTTSSSIGTTPGASTTLVTLRILTPDILDWDNYPDNPVAAEIRRKMGVTLQFIEADTNKMRVLTADGDLPDIIMARQTPEFQMRTVLIQSKNAIPLDGLLKTYGQDILKNAPGMLAFSRKFWSCGENRIYALAPQVGNEFIGIEPGIGPVMRWDYYKELGCPKLKDENDILNVLDQMVKMHPQTEEGKKTYGVGIYNDMGSWCYQFLTGPMHGYPGTYDVKNNLPIPYYTMIDGPYWTGTRFLYNANKRGILDPDSLIMGYNDLEVKMTQGSVFYTVQNWTSQRFNSANSAQLKGYQVIPVEGSYERYNSQYTAGWYDRPFMISRNCMHPEKAMELLNYFYSYDGVRTITSGVKGRQWDIVNGKPKLMDEVMDAYSKGGEDWNRLQISGKSQGLGNLCGLSGIVTDPEDGAPLCLFDSDETIARFVTPLQKDYSDYYGAAYPGQVIMNMVKIGKMFDRSQDLTSLVGAALPTEPTDISLIGGKLDECFMQGVDKCILAKTDEEFNENMQKVINDINALGYQRYFAWQKQAWIDAKSAVGLN